MEDFGNFHPKLGSRGPKRVLDVLKEQAHQNGFEHVRDRKIPFVAKTSDSFCNGRPNPKIW